MAMKSGGPAFPHEIVNNSPDEFHAYGEVIPSGKTATFSGMTLRDYFAAKAMQAMIAAHEPQGAIPGWAYEMADAMLLAREAS